MATNITEDMEDYKEKYENAVNELRNLLSMLMEQNVINADGIINTNLERIFPELRESEDEKIRKELIQFVKDYPNLPNGKYCRTDFFNWLEKQGEQKQNPCEDCDHAMLNCGNFPCEEKKGYNSEQEPADKFEPKFNVGDWLVCCNYEPEQIIGIRNDMYEMSNGDIRPIKMINKNHNIRLWTIQDAKDGDVLATKNFIFIFKNIDSDNGVSYYCHYEISDHEEDNLFEVAFPLCWMGRVGNGISYYSPATKEQRELLFSKMKEAGYEWDAEDKVLRKIGQKPADKVEPKFKVGDWVVQGKMLYQIEKITDLPGNHFQYWTTDGVWFGDGTEAHLWTIQDAKDGDVFCIHSSESDSDCIFLYQNTVEIESGRNVAVAYCGIDVYANRIEFGIQGPDCIDVRKIKPATKKQRDLLFSKMKEVGYEWDAEKKELKKINLIKAEHGKYYYCIKDYFSGGKKFSSKGDIVQALRGWPIMGLEDISEYFLPVDKIQKSTWSEEDERIRGAICDTLDRIDEHIMKCHQRLTHQQVKDWLKSLKERIQPQTEQEWSEGDEIMLDRLIKHFNKNEFDRGYEVGISAAKFNQWKPTEEQMDALGDAVKLYKTTHFDSQHYKIETLYNDLKKL